MRTIPKEYSAYLTERYGKGGWKTKTVQRRDIVDGQACEVPVKEFYYKTANGWRYGGDIATLAAEINSASLEGSWTW